MGSAIRLLQPEKRWVPVLVGLLFLNAVLGGVSFLMLLPVLEVLIVGKGIGTSVAEQVSNDLSVVAKFVVYLLSWMGISNVLMGLALVIIVLFFIKALVMFLSSVITVYVTQCIRRHWMMRMAEYYFEVPFDRIIDSGAGEIIQDMRRQTKLAASYVQGTIEFWLFVSLSTGLLVSMMFVNWQICLGGLLVIGMLYYSVGRRLGSLSSSLGRKNVLLSQVNQQVLGEVALGLKELRIQDNIAFAKSRLLKSILTLNRNQVIFRAVESIPTSFGEFVGVLLLGIALYVISLMPVNSTAGLLTEFLFIAIGFTRLFSFAMTAQNKRMGLLNKKFAVDIVLRNCDRSQLMSRPLVERGALKPNLCVRCDNVSLGHRSRKERLVLDCLSLDLSFGETVYVVGASGSGKSTLVDLLAGLHRPWKGRVVYNCSVIPKIGYVSPNTILFDDSLRANIMLGVDCDDAFFRAVLDLTGLNNTVASLPEGLETRLAGVAGTLSEGQAKRIGIARALVSQPEFLLIDEATSTFESELERQIVERIRQLMPELLLVIVTHRLSSIPSDARVVLLDQGNVAADGRIASIRSRVEASLSS